VVGDPGVEAEADRGEALEEVLDVADVDAQGVGPGAGGLLVVGIGQEVDQALDVAGLLAEAAPEETRRGNPSR
jgi:hypothetical protein